MFNALIQLTGIAPSARPRRIVLAAAAAALMACGGDGTGPAVTSTAKVTVTATPGSIEPGQAFNVAILVEPSGTEVVENLRVEVSGLVTAAETVQVNSPGTFSLTRFYVVPTAAGTGQVAVHATARVAGGTALGGTQVAVADTVPPTIQLQVSPADSIAQPGDSLTLYATGGDNVGLRALVVRVTGALTRTDSLALTGQRGSQQVVGFRIPRNITLNQTLSFTAQAVDVAGNVRSTTQPQRRVTDAQAPSVTGNALNARGTSGYAPGDTVSLQLTASDNVLLVRYGYRLSGTIALADSFTVNDSADARTIKLPVTAAWAGVTTLQVFAVDGGGHRQQAVSGTITVASRARRSIVSVPIAGSVRDVAIESRRGLAFVSQPDSHRVAVLDVVTGALQPYIVLPAGSDPRGVDVTLSGDSLLIAMRRTNHLQVVNLVTGVQDTVRVNSDPFLNRGPDNVRVMANGKALVSITFDGSGYGGSIVALDLATRGISNKATVTEVVPLCRSGNRARLLILVDDSCCPIDGMIYDAATDGFVASHGTVSRYFVFGSSDYGGNRYLVNGTIYDANLVASGTRTPTGYSDGLATAIAMDGTFGFFATPSGVVRARLSDGQVVETFTLGAQPSRITLSTDGLTLVAITPGQVHLIDLW